MNTHADKTTETKSNAIAGAVAALQNTAHQLTDNRPEAIAQRKIQKAAGRSEQVKQLTNLQALANSSQQVKQLMEVQKLADADSSQKKIQKKEIKPLVIPKPVIQRNKAEELKEAKNSVEEDARQAIEKHVTARRTISHTKWISIYNSVAGKEGEWTASRDHVMLGDNTNPPKGFHSKNLEDGDANCEGFGVKRPSGVGGEKPYKQKVRNKNTKTVKANASTFFPDNWDEEKIQAAVLLRNANMLVEGAQGKVTKLGDTYFPEAAIPDPPG